MSLLGVHIISDAQFETFKNAMAAAGHSVETFALSEVDKAIAAAKTTSLGASVNAAITAVESKTLTGPQKFEEALAAILPEVLHYVTSGGFAALEADVADFARHLLQSTFNDVKSTTAAGIAGQVLHLVGAA